MGVGSCLPWPLAVCWPCPSAGPLTHHVVVVVGFGRHPPAQQAASSRQGVGEEHLGCRGLRDLGFRGIGHLGFLGVLGIWGFWPLDCIDMNKGFSHGVGEMLKVPPRLRRPALHSENPKCPTPTFTPDSSAQPPLINPQSSQVSHPNPKLCTALPRPARALESTVLASLAQHAHAVGCTALTSGCRQRTCCQSVLCTSHCCGSRPSGTTGGQDTPSAAPGPTNSDNSTT